MSQAEESEFERRVRQVLVDSADSLDGRTRSRLTQARYAALAQGVNQDANRAATHSWLRVNRWAPAGAAAMAVVAGMLLLGPRVLGPLTVRPAATSAFDDIDLLADADGYGISLDDQDVDYEFYEWAADQNGAASGLGT